MANSYFQFKQFTIHQDRCAMKVTTDACLFGAWVVREVGNRKPEVGSVLDIGAGTGLLSLMLAQKINASIDAIEIDKGAAEQAKENSLASPWSGSINIIHGDVKEPVVLPRSQYDVIVSNPPFYENELTSPHIKKNIAHHDEALLLQELLPVISKTLAPGGVFFLLLPFKRKEEVELELQKNQLAIIDGMLARQSTQHDYFRLLIAGTHAENSGINYTKNEIAIRDEKNEYTPEFTKLLKDYYLHL
jgi:tRNA1Val (adenine37-N6)-methyltransferase